MILVSSPWLQGQCMQWNSPAIQAAIVLSFKDYAKKILFLTGLEKIPCAKPHLLVENWMAMYAASLVWTSKLEREQMERMFATFMKLLGKT